jgi:hypothetical protein
LAPRAGSRAGVDSEPGAGAYPKGNEIAANSDGCTGIYLNISGQLTWTNPPSCLPAPSPELNSAAMVRSPVGTEIANTLVDNSLQFLANTDGSPTWFSEQIVAPGLTNSAPAMVRTVGGIDKAGTDIAVMTG